MAEVITFIGWHDSGKNTLTTQVVKHLKASGYKVAVVKSSSETGVFFDTPETDTDKHWQAGADEVLFVAPDQMVLQTKNSNLSLTTLAHRYFPDVDIIIGEGFTETKRISKIEVVIDKNQILRNEVHGVIAVVSDLNIAGEHVFRLDESKEIAEFIRKRFLKDGRKPGKRVSLLVNGKTIPLKPFVQDALAGTLAGFVESLKFSKDASEIDIRIKIDNPAMIP